MNYGDGAAYAWGDASGGCHGALGMASPSKGIWVSLPTKVSAGSPVGTRSVASFVRSFSRRGGDRRG